MRDVEPFVVRTFRKEVPGFLRTWRPGTAVARWDRHYLVKPGHSLALVGPDIVELRRMRAADGFRVEQTLLSAAFPLDWMSLSLIASALPKPFNSIDLDGRSAQAFVDSLAFAELPQASVLKEIVTVHSGAVTGVATTMKVPDWRAAEAVSVAFESYSASALRSLLSAGGMRKEPHRDLDDWLRTAHAATVTQGTRAA